MSDTALDLRTADVATLRAAGSELTELLADRLEAGQFVTWSQAHAAEFGGAFRNARISRLIAAADDVVPGASALFVRADGSYSATAATEDHATWLQARGFAEEDVPGRQSLLKQTRGGFSPDKVDPVKLAAIRAMEPERFATLYKAASTMKQRRLVAVATPQQQAALAAGLSDEDLLAGL